MEQVCCSSPTSPSAQIISCVVCAIVALALSHSASTATTNDFMAPHSTHRLLKATPSPRPATMDEPHCNINSSGLQLRWTVLGGANEVRERPSHLRRLNAATNRFMAYSRDRHRQLRSLRILGRPVAAGHCRRPRCLWVDL